ncbi:MAG: D-aminoacyl-tRNA deacylase [Bacteriovoracia bacterium]
MRAVIQRVKQASVTVDGKKISEIGPGLLTLLGVAKGDSEATLAKLIDKIVHLRIFEDEAGKMNRSLKEVAGGHLLVSQFTLLADCSSGRRPSFVNAEAPAAAKALFDRALTLSEAQGVLTRGGIFQADMKVELANDGPVTLVLDLTEAK